MTYERFSRAFPSAPRRSDAALSTKFFTQTTRQQESAIQAVRGITVVNGIAGTGKTSMKPRRFSFPIVLGRIIHSNGRLLSKVGTETLNQRGSWREPGARARGSARLLSPPSLRRLSVSVSEQASLTIALGAALSFDVRYLIW